MGYTMKDLDRLGPAAKRQIIQKASGAAVLKQQAAQKKSKYNARKAERTLPSGSVHKFDSEAEARRFDELMLMLDAGAITDLKLQPEFTLQEGYVKLNGEHVKAAKYKADFSYKKIVREGKADIKCVLVVEDVKGMKTDLYELKKKLAEGGHCVEVKEIK